MLPESELLARVEKLLNGFMKAVNEHVIDALDLELAEILVLTLNEMADVLLEKQKEEIDPKWLIKPHLVDMMKFALKALAVFQSFTLQGKPDPDNIKDSKKLIKVFLYEKLTQLSETPDESFFDKNIAQVVSDNFAYKRSDSLSTVSLQAPTWRFFHALFDYLNADHLQKELPEPESIFNRQARQRAQQQTDLKALDNVDEDEEEEDEGATVEEIVEEEQKAIEPAPVEMAMQSQEASPTTISTGEEKPEGEENKIEAMHKALMENQEEAQAEVKKWKKRTKMTLDWEQIDEQESDDESVRSATVFDELSRVFLAILKNGDSTNFKVKSIALYKLFPRFVNASLTFLKHENSEKFQRILIRGAKIEWGSDNAKI